MSYANRGRKSGGAGGGDGGNHDDGELPGAIVPGDIFQLRMENDELRSRLRAVESIDDRSELLDSLEEKNAEIKALERKFLSITKGLGTVESERRMPRQSTDRAKKERNDAEAKAKCAARDLRLKVCEVRTMSQRIDNQERRIEVLNAESKEHRRGIAKLEEDAKALVALRAKLDEVEEELRACRSDEREARRALDEASSGLERAILDVDWLRKMEASLRKQLEETTRDLNEKIDSRLRRVQELEDEMKTKDGTIDEVKGKLTARNREHMQTVAEAREKMEQEKNKMKCRYSLDKIKAVDLLQVELTAKESTVQNFEGRIKDLVSELDDERGERARIVNEHREEGFELKRQQRRLDEDYTAQIKMTASVQECLAMAETNLEKAQKDNAALEAQQEELLQRFSDARSEVTAFETNAMAAEMEREKENIQNTARIRSLGSEISSEKATADDLRSKLQDSNLLFKAEREELSQRLSDAQGKVAAFETNAMAAEAGLEEDTIQPLSLSFREPIRAVVQCFHLMELLWDRISIHTIYCLSVCENR